MIRRRPNVLEVWRGRCQLRYRPLHPTVVQIYEVRSKIALLLLQNGTLTNPRHSNEKSFDTDSAFKVRHAPNGLSVVSSLLSSALSVETIANRPPLCRYKCEMIVGCNLIDIRMENINFVVLVNENIQLFV
ncbi:hypothetical protein AVEN_100766-1 [Araneus ventricosus]|uniref:Uncharacterized protein n=1 Tax=Araneus ventricosus TaxID=182803 RepID=A0A4Y2QMX8_ARAVE|nr:hypothetical protein AVEN_100763-1 [Araneus ventricosus]GBN64677.1 hypothetical protein AVEN_100766-1 [Araneus ventricosus]